MRSLSIDIVSDVVCPWCLIGSRRLELALAELPDVRAEITYRPFLLDPLTPPEGVDLRLRLRQKYGDPEPLFRRVEAAAKEAGVVIDFTRVRKGVPTLRAHTLLRRAALRAGPESRPQADLAKALFHAYFAEGRDVSAFDVLIELGVAHGFDEAEVIALLEDPAELEATRAEAEAALARGIAGVPHTVVGGRFPVPGAQSPELFKRAIERALAPTPEAE
jgi:predicted DsbA family dithiol-disulfide isomerase